MFFNSWYILYLYMALEFQENNSFKSRVILAQAERPKILNLILKTGIVKDEKSAVYVIFGIIVICILAAIYIYTTFIGNTVNPITQEEYSNLPDEVKNMLPKPKQ